VFSKSNFGGKVETYGFDASFLFRLERLMDPEPGRNSPSSGEELVGLSSLTMNLDFNWTQPGKVQALFIVSGNDRPHPNLLPRGEGTAMVCVSFAVARRANPVAGAFWFRGARRELVGLSSLTQPSSQWRGLLRFQLWWIDSRLGWMNRQGVFSTCIFCWKWKRAGSRGGFAAGAVRAELATTAPGAGALPKHLPQAFY
jgi:hypothetical protein